MALAKGMGLVKDESVGTLGKHCGKEPSIIAFEELTMRSEEKQIQASFVMMEMLQLLILSLLPWQQLVLLLLLLASLCSSHIQSCC